MMPCIGRKMKNAVASASAEEPSQRVPAAPSRDVSVPVQLDGAVGEPQRGRTTSGVPLLDEIGQEVHDTQVVRAAAEAPAQQKVVPLADAGLQGRAEGVEEGPPAQRRQGALQVQEVGGAMADVGVWVGQPAHKGAGVRR